MVLLFFVVIIFLHVATVFAGSSVSQGHEPVGQDLASDTQKNSLPDMKVYEFIELPDPVSQKVPRPQQSGFLRIRPKSADNPNTPDLSTYRIEFLDEQTKKTTDKALQDKTRISLETTEDIDKSYFMKRVTSKEYKTDVSVGYKLTPFYEILLGRGFLMERKEPTKFETRDDGWRIRFKANF